MKQSFTEILEKISMSRDLNEEEASLAIRMILQGEISNEEVAAFLMGMRTKGETIIELTAFVQEMREAAVKVEVDITNAVDLCGTGGDRSGTFNISTAAMFVVAGAGIPVLKHGNRSVSSQSGSYDVLEALGAVPNLQKEEVERLYNETGMAFMFAPNFHPAMKYVMPARRAMRMRTFFNMLGPLLNPAGVKHQVIGTFSREAASQMIRILSNLHTESACTIHAHDGLDEVSLSSESEVFELGFQHSDGVVTFAPESLGYRRVALRELLGGDAMENAGIIRKIVEGNSTEAQRNVVELNAAFAIRASRRTDSLEKAKELAAQSLDSGEAAKKLEKFVQESQKVAKN